MNEKIAIAILSLGVLFVIGVLSDTEPKKQPTLQQWAARLIEHVEQENINEAYMRFAHLVERGMDPAHAFEVVVSG